MVRHQEVVEVEMTVEVEVTAEAEAPMAVWIAPTLDSAIKMGSLFLVGTWLQVEPARMLHTETSSMYCHRAQ